MLMFYLRTALFCTFTTDFVHDGTPFYSISSNDIVSILRSNFMMYRDMKFLIFLPVMSVRVCVPTFRAFP